MSLEQFMTEWNTYSELAKEKGKKSLYMLMTFRAPKKVGDNAFKITVATETLRETFNAEKIYIVDRLAKAFGTTKFEILTEVDELPDDEKGKFLSTPKEKYDHMVKLNPNLKKLMDDLDLDFNY